MAIAMMATTATDARMPDAALAQASEDLGPKPPRGAEGRQSADIQARNEQGVALRATAVRAAPEAGSNQIAALKPDDAVRITGAVRGTNWLRVTYQGRDGFVQPGAVRAVAPSELEAWSKVSSTGSLADVEGFLRRHPNGVLTPRARALAAELRKSGSIAGAGASGASNASRTPAMKLPPGWALVPCATSGVVIGDGGQCAARQVDATAAGTGQNQGYNRQFLHESEAAGRRISWFLQYASGPGGFEPYNAATSERLLRRDIGQLGLSSANWGRYRGFGDTGYIDFTSGDLNCMAIDHAGEGYRWLLRGYACQKSAIANPEGLVRELLAATRIGPGGSTRNALGGALQAVR